MDSVTLAISMREPGISQKEAWWSKMVVTPCLMESITRAWALAFVAARSRWRSMYHHWPSSTS